MDDDAEIQIVRLTIENGTNQSAKKTILTCLLIMVARRRRRAKAVAALATGVALAHYWHLLVSTLSRLIH